MNYRYKPLSANEINPKGWLKKQLELQANGLAGQLDRVWPDVRDSKWFGGDREGWERAPYWLDGFMPLAYLLRDEDMIGRVRKYMDLLLQAQQENGWFYPPGTVTEIEKYDTWAQILLGKVLVCYYELSKDDRIPGVIYRFLRSFYELLSTGTIKLFAWGEHRWFEFFITLNWAHEQFPSDAWILKLAKIFKEQGTDYASLTEKWKKPVNRWTQDTHIVNLVMMLKYEAVSCDLLGDEYKDIAETLYTVLNDYNGMPAGIFAGDECLSGLSPIQGAELCSVVELMYSYELLYAKTGDGKWMERLEKAAFNALPATISDDMWAHQYDQQSNQIAAIPFPGKAIYRTNHREAGVFGLEPEFGCCTANFGQGWPKLAQSVFYKADDGLMAAMMLPSECTVEHGGVPVKVTADTSYPFRNAVTYTVTAEKKTDMKLHIRIPSFAKNLTVNGKTVRRREELVFGGFRKGETVISIAFETVPTLVSRPNRLYTAECGSLVFSLPIKADIKTKEYTKANVERKAPYCDYHYFPASDWNYGFVSKALVREEKNGDEAVPFSSMAPSVVLKAQVSHIDWGYEAEWDILCAKVPASRVPLDEPQEIELYPYGCAKLRMTELPVVKK